MAHHGFGAALRALRRSAGWTQRDLAERIKYSHQYVNNVECGIRPPTLPFATACEAALDCAPVLSTLVTTHGEDVNRRTAGTLVALATAGGLTAVTAGPSLVDLIRQTLEVDPTEGWAQVAARFEARYYSRPDTQFGRDLAAHLLVIRQELGEVSHARARVDLLCAAARLGQLQGMYLGNSGDVGAGRDWHDTAINLAERSKHLPTRVAIQGRAVVLGPYEGMSVRETLSRTDRVLTLADGRPSLGAMGAYAALVHLHALTGNLAEGRRAVAAMAEIAEALPANATGHAAGPWEWVVLFHNFLECRIGDEAHADRAFATAEQPLRAVPLWHLDAHLYRARALVRHGDPAGGIALALEHLRPQPKDVNVRVHNIGVNDILAAVPAGFRSDAWIELGGYASPEPGPWETLR